MNTKDRKTPEEMINEAGNESFNNSGRLGGSFNGIDRIPFVVWSAVAKLMQQYADQEIASFMESDAVEFLHWFHKYYYQDYVKETTKELYAKFKKQSTSPKPTTDSEAIKVLKEENERLKANVKSLEQLLSTPTQKHFGTSNI